ncbi:hypothetical protein TrLO_g6451 [Triparma laevis f. longispina]|uniref:WW domain-containing protein n=1 Tax=Triparma laevis f. longispina TaxID=1714387 RepID=A0A9W6ZWL8_9STRA|nr:hypothetical protein TrLO_g6451 [Triparma laevis f. longispina]
MFDLHSWNIQQHPSVSSMHGLSRASGALTGRKKKEKGKLKVGEDLEVLGIEGGDEVGNPMQGEAVLGVEAGEIEMKKSVVDKKHLLQASGFNALGKNKLGKGATGPRRKNKHKFEDDTDDDVKPPDLPTPIAPPSDHEEDEGIPPPPPTWKRIWDESAQAYYYQHSHGVESTWDKPDEFIE